MCETHENYPAPIRSQIELQGTTRKVLYNAFLDTRANHNLISFEVWNQLGRSLLDQSPIKVKGVNGLTSYVTGVLTTQLYSYNGHMDASFLVMPAWELLENILVGRTWMSNTNCQIDRVTNSITRVIPKCPIGHCSHCDPHSLTPSSTTSSKPILESSILLTILKPCTQKEQLTIGNNTTTHPLTARMWVPQNQPVLPSSVLPTQRKKKTI